MNPKRWIRAALLLGVFGLVLAVSMLSAYQRGYKQGETDELGRWVATSFPDGGVITAKRDLSKNPILKGRMTIRENRNVNSIPQMLLSRKHSN